MANENTRDAGKLMQTIGEVAVSLQGTCSSDFDSRYIGMEEAAEEAIKHLFVALFPYHFGKSRDRFDPTEKRSWELMRCYDALSRALRFVVNDQSCADFKADELIRRLPKVLEYLNTDVQAAYEGDPAAISPDEIILTYPGFKAICIYRIAHELYEMKIPILPRIMTEYAHAMTGIDIHPGATIGKYFFIDHGTGVVVGETTTIGEHVKLYQHVTLGAKSFEANDDGSLVKGIKRHPDIGNYVVVYAGATILGGNTRIGDHCVIGGSVWLTHSLPAGETITVRVTEGTQVTNSNETK